MREKITLELTREHAQVVQDACEMLMRLKLGQTGYAVDMLIGWPKPDRDDMDMKEYRLRRDMANDILKTALRVLLGDNKYGLPDGKKDTVEALAYEIWGTMRHALYMHDEGDYDSCDVRSREPMSESGLTMPVCRVEG
jgi:hypothetical protein